MESSDRIVMLNGFRKIFKLLETITGALKDLHRVNDTQTDINIFLAKRIERLEKKANIEKN